MQRCRGNTVERKMEAIPSVVVPSPWEWSGVLGPSPAELQASGQRQSLQSVLGTSVCSALSTHRCE